MKALKIEQDWRSFLFLFIWGFLFLEMVSLQAEGIVINLSTQKNYGNDLQQAIDEAGLSSLGIPVLLLEGEFMGNFSIANKDLTLRGSEFSGATLNGNNQSRVLAIFSNPLFRNIVKLENLTITNGLATMASGGGGMGGGILNLFSDLSLDKVNVINNIAVESGGGIANFNGILRITNKSKINQNSAASGGGIINDIGSFSIENSEVSKNQATAGGGGGILLRDSTLSRNKILDSQVLDNTAFTVGGGIDNGTLSKLSIIGSIKDIENGSNVLSKVKGNTASLFGGGIYNNGDLEIESTRIRFNQLTGSALTNSEARGGGLYNGERGTAILKNSLISRNVIPSNSEGGGIFNNNNNSGFKFTVVLEQTSVRNNEPNNIRPKSRVINN